jgi:hypothetical protein
MLRRFTASSSQRAVATATAAVSSTAVATTASRSHYNWHIWSNATRQPQLTPEQRKKIEVDESKFPAEFKDFDETDPYKGFPLWIEGMHTWSYFFMGAELAFIVAFYELVFPKSI